MASEGDSYSTLTLKGTPVTELRLPDIKKELEKRGLSKSGSRTQLIDRLKGQLLLEKLQQDAAQSSGDELEGKVPNMALQQDDKAGQSEFVRQYLQQQQRNLEIQMEMKKQVQEERKKQSADESSADEANTALASSCAPDMTSPKKVKDDTSNAPAKEGAKMSRPARKSGRNSSKGENGQEGQQVKEKARSPTPERRRQREHSHSESSSSSRSPTPEKSSRSGRGQSARGRAKRGGGRRGGQHGRKGSRSSSPSSPEEVMPKKKQRRRTNSSSRSGSRSPQMVSPEMPTRRSSRRSSTALKTDQTQEEELPRDGGGDKNKKSDREERAGESGVQKRRWRKKASTKAGTELEESQRRQEELGEAVHSPQATASRSEQDELVLLPADSTKEGGGASVNSQDQPDIDSSSAKELQHTETQSSSARCNKPVAEPDAALQAHEVVIEAGSSVTIRDCAEDKTVPDSNLQESEAAPAKYDQREGSSGSESRDPAISMGKDAGSKKVELEKSSSLSEESEVQTSDQKYKKDIEKKNPAPARSEHKDHSSPAGGSRQRKPSYSSDSSSSRSRSPSKEKQTRSSSSSGSGSSGSSSDDSPARKSVIRNQEKVHDKNRPSQSVSGAVPMEVDVVKTDAPVLRSVSHPGKDDGKSASSSASSEPKTSAQHQGDGQKVVVKGHANEGDEAKDKQEKTKTELNAGAGKKTQLQDRPKAESAANAEAEEEAASKKGTKKRKWGSKTSKAAKTTKRTSSMEISSDVLKNLIGDVKLTETVFEMETEVVNTLDYDEHEEDRRDVKVKRNAVQSPQAEERKTEDEDARKVETRAESSPELVEVAPEPEKKIIKLSTAAPKVAGKTKVKEAKKSKDEKKKADIAGMEINKDPVPDKESKEKMFAVTRPSKPLLPTVDEPEPVSGSQSPARNPPDRVVRIAGLVRPFTVGQLKELLRRSGELDDEYFWINAIKSHCLAAYKRQEDAVAARAALHGTRWPQSNPKILIVDYATVEDVKHRKEEGDVPLPAFTKQPQEEQKKPKEEKKDEEKEKKLKAREQREKDRKEREKEERGRQEVKERKREAEKKNPVREWDRDKIQQMSRSRSKSVEKDRVARRSRSPDRDHRKRGQQNREKKDEERRKERKQKDVKAVEEPPAKLLDDLFRKTKAVPCIYWLPLTEEQAQQRLIKKQEQEKERLKRIAEAEEREKEELRKRETARLARQREREKARDKSRERGRQERSKSSRSRSRSRSRRRR